MGIVKKPSMQDYWLINDLHTPSFSKTISRNRFESILRVLYFADNLHPNLSNKLWKLGKFLPDLVKSIKERVNLREYLCVDESLLAFHGRLRFPQYMPLKRARFGIKYFRLVDTETKFLANVKINLGKLRGLDSA